MLNTDPVKIPEIEQRIRIARIGEYTYVQYLADRKYDCDKKYNIPEWVNIGKQIAEMPGLMYPNSHYFQYFEGEAEKMNERMTDEEKTYSRFSALYERATNFFEGLYNEFRQQTRRDPAGAVSAYKVEMINEILAPLKEMMKDEEYAELLPPIGGENDGEDGMNCSDVMMILTQYKSALEKYHKSHR